MINLSQQQKKKNPILEFPKFEREEALFIMPALKFYVNSTAPGGRVTISFYPSTNHIGQSLNLHLQGEQRMFFFPPQELIPMCSDLKALEGLPLQLPQVTEYL